MNHQTRPRTHRNRLGALFGAAAAGLALALAPLAPATAAILPASVASVDDPATQPSADDPVLTVTPASNGVTQTTSATLTLGFANATATAFPEGTVEISRGEALGSADDVDAWLAGTAGTAGEQLASIDSDEIATGSTTTATESVDLGDIPAGAYPILATYSADGTEAEARTVVVATGGDSPEVALVVPITGPVDSRGLYTADTLTTLTAPDGLLTAQLDAVAGTDAILAIDPAIPAAIRALGSSAPQPARDWLDQLMLLPNDRFALQFADADPAVQVAAGLDAPLATAGLDAYLTGYTSDPAPEATPAADETEAPAETLPTEEELLAVGGSDLPLIAWPSPGSAGDDAVTSLAADGYASLVPSSSTADGAAALGEDALAYDDELSGRLTEIAQETDGQARASELVAATAAIWLASSADDQPLLLALDRMGSDALAAEEEDGDDDEADATPDVTAEGLRDAILSTMRSPGLDAQGLGAVLDARSGAVSLAAPSSDDEGVAAVQQFAADEPKIAHTSTALEQPALLTSQTRAEFLRTIAVSWATNPDGQQTRFEAFALLDAQRIDAIVIQEPQPVQLLSPEAPMPIWIQNDLPYTAKVTVIATPNDPRLSIEERTEVTAQPNSATRVSIPIEARVGSGDVTVHYRLEAATGDQIGPDRSMQVTVRADWERIGIVVMVVLVVGLLGFGAYRQVRRRRREKAAEAEPSE
ncbi:DUF6049 family protein [Microbacterium indicum]|uniref:DUF6049 family protein n=1 Tax=Microbacterium indicum TaxID=358100 RepID=UPI0003F56613|nr:DUF6049 family protein [Microbacterium indicum]